MESVEVASGRMKLHQHVSAYAYTQDPNPMHVYAKVIVSKRIHGFAHDGDHDPLTIVKGSEYPNMMYIPQVIISAPITETLPALC